MLDLLFEPWTSPFMIRALLAIIFLSLMCSSLSAYIILRRMALVGDALAHTTLPGIVICHAKGWSLFLGAFAADIVTALGIAWLSRRKQMEEDTAMGIFYSAMFALGVILMAQFNVMTGLNHILFGSILEVSFGEVVFLAGMTLFILVVMALIHKELELASFDETYARHVGVRPDFIRYLLLIMIALCVVSCVRYVGVVLTSALLVTPAATAAMLTKDLKKMIGLSMVISFVSGLSGLYLSYYQNWPSGAAIVAAGAIVFLIIKGYSEIFKWRDQVKKDHRDDSCHD